MTPRLRVLVVVLVVGAAAAAAVAGVVVATGGPEPHLTLRKGFPPLALDLGLRSDGEARALSRAETLYDHGRRRAAARIFARSRSIAAAVGLAYADWPNGTLSRLRTLASEHPRDAFVLLHLGLAAYWSRQSADAVAAWRQAVRTDPDTPSAVTADNLLHPNFPRNLPEFVPSFVPPASLGHLPPQREVEVLARRAATGGARAKLLYGVTLQHLYHPVSAERWFARAAAQAPGNAEAQVAAGVGLFRKANPTPAFADLGPLVRRFPRAPTVRFHLGLLLLWTGRLEAAKTELRRAVREGPQTTIGREARSFLAELKSLRR